MPCAVQFQGELLAEHLHCRSQAALFDVLTWEQATLTDATAAAALERLVPGDMLSLKPGRQRYTLLLTNEAGGIIPRRPDGRQPWPRASFPGGQRRPQGHRLHPYCQHFPTFPPVCSSTRTRTAPCSRCKGPAAAAVIARLGQEAAALPFAWASPRSRWSAFRAWSPRSGYTGEDGFEISVPAEHAVTLADRLFAEPGPGGRPGPASAPATLLRLEARPPPLWQRHR